MMFYFYVSQNIRTIMVMKLSTYTENQAITQNIVSALSPALGSSKGFS